MGHLQRPRDYAVGIQPQASSHLDPQFQGRRFAELGACPFRREEQFIGSQIAEPLKLLVLES